jgi:hypothetical protein
MESEEKKETKEKIRNDFMRRLFAVAISVGAASTIAQMKWVIDGTWPTLAEYQQFAILLAAMTATVLSWDGYLLSIQDRPLGDGVVNFFRFAIDIFLVFVYMFLLMTSRHITWWLPIHALTFVLYAFWDFLTVCAYTKKYFDDEGPYRISRVYFGALVDSPGVRRSAIITLIWMFYFVALAYITFHRLEGHVFIMAIFVILGLTLYRVDKTYRFPMLRRLGIVIFLIGLAFVYIQCGAAFDDAWIISWTPLLS